MHAVPRRDDGPATKVAAPHVAFRSGRETISAREAEAQAFVCLNVDGARLAADASTRRYRDGRTLSPIDGCPVAVEDNVETADLPTQMNSPNFKDWRSRRDAACVLALRSGGAVVLGKTALAKIRSGVEESGLLSFESNGAPAFVNAKV